MRVWKRCSIWAAAIFMLSLLISAAAPVANQAEIYRLKASATARHKLTADEIAAIKRLEGQSEQPSARSLPQTQRPPHGTLDDYISIDTTYSWIDMAGATTITGIGDDDNVGPYALGITFPYYGNNYSQMYVNSNGSVSPTDTNWYNLYNPTVEPCLPSANLPNNTIYGWWGDLDPSSAGAGTVKYRSDVAEGRFIVAWEGVPYWTLNGGVGAYNFQIVVRSDGVILVNYGALATGLYADSCFAGIENSDGTQAVQVWCCNGQQGTPPQSNTAIRYLAPNGVPNPVTNLAATPTGNSVTLTWIDPDHDTNNNPLTPDSVLIYRGSAVPDSQIGHVAHGVQSFTAANQPQGNILYFARAKSGVWIGAPTSVSVPVGNPSYFSNFDTNDGGWTADAVWSWGVPSNPAAPAPHSGNSYWGTGMTGNYGDGVCGHLDLSPGLSVSSASATMEFWYWYQIESGFDGCNVKVSTDDGNTWEIVTPQDGYPGSTNTANTCNPSETAWTGSLNPQWRYAIIPLGQYVGETLMFRFTFGSDPSVNYTGFFFDDMTIWGLQPPSDGIPLPVTNLQGTSGGTTTVTLTWTDPNHDTNGNPLTPDSILIYRGNAQPGSQIGHVLHGVQTIVIPGQPVGNQVYYARAKAGTYLSQTANVGFVVGSPSYTSNFDTDNGGWVADGVWEWGAPTNTAGPQPHSGTNVWACGLTANYDISVCGHLDLSLNQRVSSASATLEFWSWYQTEQGWDGCEVQVSTDSGATWQMVHPQPAYSGVLNGQWACGGTDSTWTGTGNTGWRYTVVPIGQFINQIPIFRFTFGSDASVVYAGFFLDDVIIWGLAPRQAIVGQVRQLGGANPPLAGAWVRAGNDSVQTDASGNYSLSKDPGTYTVIFSHATHCDSVRTGVVLQAGENTTVNASLKAPVAVPSASSLTYIVHRNTTALDSFSITNTGTCPLHFQVTDSVTWLIPSPALGDVNPGSSTEIVVTAEPGLMQPGEYQANIRVLGNSVGSPFVIHVDMNVLTVTLLPGALPTEFALHQNYPNPFNPTTLLPFDVPRQSQVDIVVYNVMGQEVARPVSGVYAAGRYQMTFAGDNLPSGVYLVKMKAGNFTSMGKMMLLK